MLSRCIMFACVALASTSLLAGAQDVKAKRGLLTVIAAPGGGGSVSITFVQMGAPLVDGGAGQASLDLGRLSYMGCSSQPGVTCRTLANALQVSTSFGLRVDRKGSATKTATVSAFLLNAGTTTVDIDAVRLGATTQVISASTAFGVVVPHTLTLGVPTTAPAGPLSINIGVTVTVN